MEAVLLFSETERLRKQQIILLQTSVECGCCCCCCCSSYVWTDNPHVNTVGKYDQQSIELKQQNVSYTPSDVRKVCLGSAVDHWYSLIRS